MDRTIHRRALISAMGLTFLAGMAGCSKGEASGVSLHEPRVNAKYALVKMKEGTGFSAGNANASNTAYVFFDPQCPHCGRLWMASQKLLESGQIRMVWIPVAAINAKSIKQGAAILEAGDPVAMMSKHEHLLLDASGGGLPVEQMPSPAMAEKIHANTGLARAVRIDQVPFIARALPDGDAAVTSGALDEAQLKAFMEL